MRRSTNKFFVGSDDGQWEKVTKYFLSCNIKWCVSCTECCMNISVVFQQNFDHFNVSFLWCNVQRCWPITVQYYDADNRHRLSIDWDLSNEQTNNLWKREESSYLPGKFTSAPWLSKSSTTSAWAYCAARYRQEYPLYCLKKKQFNQRTCFSYHKRNTKNQTLDCSLDWEVGRGYWEDNVQFRPIR